MGTIGCSQPASKSSWDSQDFGDISMVLKMAHFRKSTGPRWVNNLTRASENISLWGVFLFVSYKFAIRYDHFHKPGNICDGLISFKDILSNMHLEVLGHW